MNPNEIVKLLFEKGYTKYPLSYDGEVWYCYLQMAMAWLREKHLIHVYAEHKAFFQEKPKKLYYHWIPFVKTLPHYPINKSGFPNGTICIDEFCDNYEEAVEAACLYALKNLI